MMTKSKVPQIRFEGFSGEWEGKEFSKTFTNISNNTLSRAELNYNFGLAKNVHYGDVLIKFGELLDVEKEEIPFIINNDFVSKFKSSKLQDGDIIIADAAEDEMVGKCTEIVNIKEEIIFSGLHTIAVRSAFSFASKYLGYYMNSPLYHNQLLPLLQGTKVLSISKSAIKNTMIYFPAASLEQTKIGNYFQQLNKLIEQKEKKHQKLKQFKKAMLDKMFPKNGANTPEIRFEGFSGKWEEKRLIDEVDLFRGLTYSPTNIVKEGGTLVLRSSNVKDNGLIFTDNVYVNSDVVNSDNVEVGDIIVVVRNGSRSLIGKHAQVKKKMNNTVIGAFMTGMHCNQSSFINSLLDTTKFNKEIEKNLGATINQITNKAFEEMFFMFPTSEEQTKIGNYFQTLDIQIDLQNKEIEKLKNIKKASLDKMFV